MMTAAAVAGLTVLPWPTDGGDAPRRIAVTTFNRWLVGIPAGERALAETSVRVMRAP